MMNNLAFYAFMSAYVLILCVISYYRRHHPDNPLILFVNQRAGILMGLILAYLFISSRHLIGTAIGNLVLIPILYIGFEYWRKMRSKP